VEDKRLFDKEGNPREETPAPKEEPASPDGRVEEPPQEKRQKRERRKAETTEKIDFISVLFSYVQTALIYLGEAEDPTQKESLENLPGAKQMIDILELMQEKTKGNLDDQEKQYLESALFDLRMRYMQK